MTASHCGSSDPMGNKSPVRPCCSSCRQGDGHVFCTAMQTGWCFSSQASPRMKSTDHALEGSVQALPEGNLSSSLTPGHNPHCDSEFRLHPPCVLTGHLVSHSARWLSNNLIERFHRNYKKPKCSSDSQVTCTSSGAKRSGLDAQTWIEPCQTCFLRHAAASLAQSKWQRLRAVHVLYMRGGGNSTLQNLLHPLCVESGTSIQPIR